MRRFNSLMIVKKFSTKINHQKYINQKLGTNYFTFLINGWNMAFSEGYVDFLEDRLQKLTSLKKEFHEKEWMKEVKPFISDCVFKEQIMNIEHEILRLKNNPKAMPRNPSMILF